MQNPILKQIRKEAGLRQADLASRLGITAPYVGELERGEKSLDPRTAMAARFILDQFFVDRATAGSERGIYVVARRTLRKGQRPNAMAVFHGSTVMYGKFWRRDHAYRWISALQRSADSRATRRVQRERAIAVAALAEEGA